MFSILGFIHLTFAQTFKFNAVGDVEFSMAGNNSHYYYNEIDQGELGGRIGVSQLNLIGQVALDSQWSINTRFLLERDKGQQLNKFVAPQLNIQWLSKNRKIGITLGSFTNPFGSFNKKQLSIDRNFIGLPLAYSYYHNISSKIGFMKGMGDKIKVSIDDAIQWGSTNLYYGGYTTGLGFSWIIKPSKINLKLALVSGASNLQKQISDPIHLSLISRIGLQPTYFWEQGFSFSHGAFIQHSQMSNRWAVHRIA